ncbi:TRM11 family SAM-dependent methyltransferase [Paenibacillus arenilitoris]|uniref:RNA methyltransferase n=1 Tax=Paenibacillus arenilitoris TaxID=2772299 RepID=A0A927CRC7_9BACL|nr:RNA methyltransferase [Paenibacillus arenilitoris]MBD2872349.1 RNA methyltransferase [Paenibacillus arenilitoris]
MYIYTYACHEDEAELCALELKTLLGAPVSGGIARSGADVHVDRSPFVKRRIGVMLEAASMDELTEKLPSVDLRGKTFKVLFTAGDEQPDFDERRQLERTAGAAIRGQADMRRPELLFGLAKLDGRLYFGPCEENGAVWLKHQRKPQNYSTALPTRAARAIVNLASGPESGTMRMIDPCCGMGTALIEAKSMGIDIEGLDANPLAVRGARVNLSHFGYPARVKLGDMRQAEGSYDAAIVDLPYNLCSVLPEDEQLAMLEAARRLARRAVVVTTEPAGRQLERAGWHRAACAKLSKGSFTRYVTVVE